MVTKSIKATATPARRNPSTAPRLHLDVKAVLGILELLVNSPAPGGKARTGMPSAAPQNSAAPFGGR
jgi:hypothetical protein